MWTLLVLAGVIASSGVQAGVNRYGITWPWDQTTSGPSSCRYRCGYQFADCSCVSGCEYRGTCCSDYEDTCISTTTGQPATTSQPSCQYNCGQHMGSCSCSSSCQFYGNCCPDYYYTCGTTTVQPITAELTTGQPSCRYNCGWNMGSCSCSSSCQYNGNCCYDFYYTCADTTTVEPVTSSQPSCRYNCGWNMGSCSCSSSCQYNGNCCYDFYYTCADTTTVQPVTSGQPSCRYNCGRDMGSCSCSSSCQYYGNCCSDYYYTCAGNTAQPQTTGQPSCRYNCGQYMGSCSCSSSCQYNGNCCYDFYYTCGTTAQPQTTGPPSCRYNCGRDMGSCSCSSSCQYYGNCCYDYYSHCPGGTDMPTTGAPCGGSLFGSGTFSSPNYPNYYPNNANCVWQLRAAYDQRIVLSITFLDLENCCSCDYISIYDGPNVNSPYLGNVCNGSQSNQTFYSTSNYLTVVFRADSSVVGRGFNADFTSALSPNSGRVDCSSDVMNIVLQRTYLNSLGIDGNNLYLNDAQCRPQISRDQVVFNFPINTCGNVQKFDNGSVVYSNALRAYTSGYGEITRQAHFKMSVGCRMEQDSVAQIMYIVRHHDNTSITGTGRFNTSMDFYTSSGFYSQVTEVPYMVTLNQNLFVQVDLSRGNGSLVLFLDTCVTSPSPHDFQTRPYYLVRNGCTMDNTYQPYVTGSRAYARFTFKAFQFLRATESVYIQCKVLICQASDYNSRCRRGCNRRAARDLGSTHEDQTVVLGPIQLKDPEEKKEDAQQKKE
ncbi:deleted in malignant brain tumors 1 protein-like isoform X2 [Pungitius pungitius]|uniref:deleted in malignant brain tumors 1 protein-like isoform X2 n=1 Tax=Pungitius pungitius TaxID=134920 RepID=UPI002E12123D